MAEYQKQRGRGMESELKKVSHACDEPSRLSQRINPFADESLFIVYAISI